MQKDQVDEIFKALLNNNTLTDEYDGTNTIVETKNVIFQISTFEY